MTIFPGSICQLSERSALIHVDCFDWLKACPEHSIHAVVTDPPFGPLEYLPEQQQKLRQGKGGVWRVPPTLGGHQRAPVPRFTVLTAADKRQLQALMTTWGKLLLPVLVPGAHVFVAANPLLSHIVAFALDEAGLERRGEIIRRVQTLRGGDRPKGAHEEFAGVTVMPRSQHEPWLLYRRPLEGRVQDNLRRWKTGALRRRSEEVPFGDVIDSSPTGTRERAIAPHPSLKPQAFMRQLVFASLPLGEGVVLDTFAGSGSTLAAADALGYQSIGLERDESYFKLAQKAIPLLARL